MKTTLSDAVESSRWAYHRNYEGKNVHVYFSPSESIIPSGYVMRNGEPPKLTYIAKMLIGSKNEFPAKAFSALKLAKDYVERNDFIWKLKGN